MLPLIAVIVMLTLKLANVIAWSWWIVFSPILAVMAVNISLLLITGVFAAYLNSKKNHDAR